ncbi:type II secretion system F family protein [Nautilia sp.]
MKFKYSGYDKTGKKIKGKIEASNEKEAISKLENILVTDIKQIKNFSINVSFRKTPSKELSKLFNSIGLYLNSSIPLVSAINLTKNQTQNVKIVKFLDYLQNSIKEGKSLYSAIESQTVLKLPEYVANTIKIGEESGKLDIILTEISKFLKDEEKLSSKTSQALIYPMFIVAVAVFMISFMLTTVVPKIVKVFENLHQDLPAITKIVIKSGNFLQDNWKIIFISLIATAVFFKYLYSKNYKFRFYINKYSLKLPVLKKIILSKELGRFSYLTSVLVGAGVNYIQAINMASNTIQNEYIKSLFQKALSDVLEGKKLSVSLKKAGFNLENSFLQALALAEETSKIDEVLKNVSEIYFEENESLINTLLSMLEPALIVVVGVSIGFIVTAMLLPMFSMSVIK